MNQHIADSPPIVWVPIKAGRLAVRGRPGRRMIATLPHYGCDRVVTLLSAAEGAAELGAAIQAVGITWLWLPLANGKTPTGEADRVLRETLPRLAAELEAGRSIIIHCSAGIHRTGMVAYALLRWLRFTPEEARNLMHQLRTHTALGMHEWHFAWGDAVVAE